MNILVITNIPNKLYKEDTDVLCEGLEELGHKVIKVAFDGYTANIPTEGISKIDVIWSPYERENSVAHLVKKELGLKAKIVGHYEWIPPWRVGLEHPKEWGYEKDNIQPVFYGQPYFKNNYATMINSYLTCNIRTRITDYLVSTIENFGNVKIGNSYVKPYVIDDKQMLSETANIEEKYQIMSTARLVPHKRIHHIIKALSLLKNPPAYKVIGDGEEKEKLNKLAKKLGVDIEFLGTGKYGIKTKTIEESMFSVNIWASLPIGESAILKKPAITYGHPTMVETHKNGCKYVGNNNIGELSKAIKFWVDNPTERVKTGEEAYRQLINNETGVYTKIEGTKKLVKILECAL